MISAVSVPNGLSLILQTKDATDKVAGTLKSKLTASGWTEDMTMNQGGMVMLSYKKDDRTVFANMTSENKMTQIAMTVSLGK